jgi:hypothetical protein
MAMRTEKSVVYAAGTGQGVVLVTFPAASAIFTRPDRHGLSNTSSRIAAPAGSAEVGLR